MKALLGWTFLLTLSVSGAQKSYIGAAACRPCHVAEFESQSASSHAQALFRAAAHPLATKFETAEPVLRAPNFRFEFGMAAGALRVRADDGKYVTELPVEWAFGAGDHAVTFVSKVSGDYYLEHSMSYYPAIGGFALTPRHDVLTATTLQQAMGQPIKIHGSGGTIADCFGCHSTGPVSVPATGDAQITESGIHCEVCHGPGSEHRAAAARGEKAAARLIDNPGRLNGEEMNRFCGRCHRVIGPTFDWNSPWSVRHQPPYLARSRCFLNSGDKFIVRKLSQSSRTSAP